MVRTQVCNPLSVDYVGLRVTRHLIAQRVARNVAHFAVWSFALTVLWSTATCTTASGARDNEGDVQFVAAETISNSLTRDVSDIPVPRYESVPPVEGKWRRLVHPVNGNALWQWGWQI